MVEEQGQEPATDQAEERAKDRPAERAKNEAKKDEEEKDGPEETRKHRVEVLAAALLGLATLGAAWAAFQSAMWDGEFTAKYQRGAMLVDQGSSAMLFAAQEIEMDGMLWIQETTQRVLGEKLQQPARLELADTWRAALSPDFRAAVDQAQTTGGIPLGSITYIEGRLAPSLQLIEEGGREFSAGREAGTQGDLFLLITVFYTVALFFGGMASVLKLFPLKVTFLALGGLVFAACSVGLVLLPVL